MLLLKKSYDRSAIDRDILKQVVIVLNSANQHSDAGSRPQRSSDQLTAAIDIGHWRLATSGSRVD